MSQPMNGALRWAAGTAVVWCALVTALLAGPPLPERWGLAALILGVLGFPVGGGAVAGWKALAQLRAGAAVAQARVALAIATALFALGVGLVWAMLSLHR